MAKEARAKRKAAEAGNILSLRVTLRDIRPPIWRRLLVPPAMTLAELHDAIQITMGWDDSHLHGFAAGGRQYGNPQMLDDAVDEERITLGELHRSGVNSFVYTYDYGDSWDHAVLIERSVPAVDGQRYPACVAGKRACPPEDCGGSWGYADLLAILADPKHPDREERLEWYGGAFDPDEFDIAAADATLGAAFHRK